MFASVLGRTPAEVIKGEAQRARQALAPMIRNRIRPGECESRAPARRGPVAGRDGRRRQRTRALPRRPWPPAWQAALRAPRGQRVLVGRASPRLAGSCSLGAYGMDRREVPRAPATGDKLAVQLADDSAVGES